MSTIQTESSAAGTGAATVVPESVGATGPLGLSGQQWRSGIAAWLGWLFDGLDMHLYTLVAATFVAQLLGGVATSDPAVREKSSWIQAAFLVGWALGGGFFGRIGDLFGRSRALALTIGTYAVFTGLSFFAQTWWHLLIFRFLAALGIGGEWAVGSSLLSETWPSKWRVWVAAVLQTGVNLGVLLACAAQWTLTSAPGYPRVVFLVGVLPAVMVYWIRRHVPEPQEWQDARDAAVARTATLTAGEAALERAAAPGIADLFRGPVRRTTLLTIGVCAFSLTGWWAFMFWHVQHIQQLPEVAAWPKPDQERLKSVAFFLVILVSIVGNFAAAGLARVVGYRRAIAFMFLGFFVTIYGCYYKPRDHVSLLYWLPWVGLFSGVFGLFTMYLPPLFPTLLRTTGAGFSYNIGRIAAAAGTILFGWLSTLQGADAFRRALLAVSFLFLPALVVALFMPELKDAEESRQ